MGATATGHESGTPSSRVDRSTCRTLTRMFWAIARRSRLFRLRRSVVSGLGAAGAEVVVVARQAAAGGALDLGQGDE